MRRWRFGGGLLHGGRRQQRFWLVLVQQSAHEEDEDACECRGQRSQAHKDGPIQPHMSERAGKGGHHAK